MLLREYVETIKQQVTRKLNSLTAEDFQGCFEQRKRRLQNCTATNQEYFEGNKIDLTKIINLYGLSTRIYWTDIVFIKQKGNEYFFIWNSTLPKYIEHTSYRFFIRI